MLKQLKEFARQFFAGVGQQQSLEQYIVSKNPQSVYDVEHWTRHYDRYVNRIREWHL